MSNVVAPRGPLPPRVYWRRRLVVLLALVGLVALVVRALGNGDPEPVAQRGAAATAPAAPDPTATKPGQRQAAADGSSRPARRQHRPARASRREAPSVSLSGAASPLAQPSGPCDASEVAIVPDVEDTPAGRAVPLRLGLSTTGRQACTFTFGPDTVALRVTSGDDLIWETLKCDQAVEEQSVVVRPGWLAYVTVPWSGRRDDEGCARTGEFAAPGYYWAEAAAVGGEPQRSQFELRTPPPEPAPEPTPAGERRAGGTGGGTGDDGDDAAGSGTRVQQEAGAQQRARTDSTGAERPRDARRREAGRTDQGSSAQRRDRERVPPARTDG